MKLKRAVNTIGSNLIAWLISLIMLVPLVLILLNSVKTNLEAAQMSLTLPTSFEIGNYLTVIETGRLTVSFFNSSYYSVFSVLLTTLLASMAAYVLSRNRSKTNKFIYFFIVLGITMPINFVTLIRVMQTLSLINSRLGVILIYSALQIPFNVFLIHSFIGRIPRDIDESAVIDGCSPAVLFFYIILPLLKPVLITVMVLTFLNTWNEFVLPLYIVNSTDKWPMTLAIYKFFGQFETHWNLMSANIVLTSLPVVLVYLFGQKYIVSGMTAGAVKG